MAKTIIMTCPVYVEEKDDVCGEKIEINAWSGEPMTYWYPGSSPGFEVVDAPCGHCVKIEERYWETVMQWLSDRERDAMEAASEARVEHAIELAWERKHGF